MTTARDRGLYEVTEGDGTRWVTNLTRKTGGREAPAGRGLVNTATVLLGILAAGLFAVSLAAQYQYILHAKHEKLPSVIEAVALDAGMIIFSLLALGLARAGQAAPAERFLIVICAAGSAAMNYAAADVASPRSVAAYVMPPVFLAIVTDRVIAVVRRHVLGMEAERSAWASTGRAALAVLSAAGRLALYGLRLVIAPPSTLYGLRRRVLLATPLPGRPVPVPVLVPLPDPPAVPALPDGDETGPGPGNSGPDPALAALAAVEHAASALTEQASSMALPPAADGDETVSNAELLGALQAIGRQVGDIAALPPGGDETALAGDLLNAVRGLAKRVDDLISASVPADAEDAALLAMRATAAAGNPLSVNALADKFKLTRVAAQRVRAAALAEPVLIRHGRAAANAAVQEES